MATAGEPSYASGASTTPLLGETIGANLHRVAADNPDGEAVVDLHQGVRYTYAQFDAEVDRLAAALIGAGMDTGDRVGIWAPNRVEWVVAQYATARASVILVNLNPAYRAHELGFALRQSGCRLLISVPEFRSASYRDLVESVRADAPDLERVVYLDTDDWPALLNQADAGRSALADREAGLSFDDPINIQYTSGTTGFPKGATLTHHNILNNGFFIGEALRFTTADRVCIPVPFYHCFGMVMGNLGCTTAPVSGSMIFTSTCGWVRPTVPTRLSRGSSTAVWADTGDVSVMP